MSSTNARIPTLMGVIGGHIFTGIFPGLFTIIVTWVVTWFVDVRVGLGMLVVALVLTRFLSDVFGAIITHRIMVRRRNEAPGGFAYAALPFVTSTFIALVVSFAGTKSLPATLLLTAVVTVVNTVILLWSKPWEPGMSSDEFAEKWQEVKSMTRDHFAEETAEFRRKAAENAQRRHDAELARQEAQRK